MKLFKLIFALGCASAFVSAVSAQQIPDLKIGNETIQFHAFASQGYIGSDDNNFLTMNTSSGSFAMTDFAFNASTQLSDKLRVGAQFYDYNVGHLGQWQPTLDWGYVDYKFKDWFGVRAGKVKTVLGLYNDTQDTAFLYTWALMPQSIYPLDLRASSIAHLGGDVYGHFGLKHTGSLDYTGYYGYVPFDKKGGYEYAVISAGEAITGETEWAGGGDLRWNTPVSGLMFGTSTMLSTLNGNGYAETPYGNFPFAYTTSGPLRQEAAYGDYVHNKWHFSGELRLTHELISSASTTSNEGSKAWFVGAAYRISKHLELGSYNSRIYLDQSSTPLNTNTNHIFDQAVTARVDLTNFWNVKVEGHFMNGYGDIYSARGFYLGNNPAGLKPDTNMLVIRTGVNF